MKKFFITFLVFLVCFGVIIGSLPTGAAEASEGSIITGGTLKLYGRPVPKNVGYQPTMTEPDRIGIVQAIAETLMNMNSDGQLVPELATSFDADPTAKTISWHLRKGVQFHDGTPFNAQAAAWNFQQMKDAGTLQYGDQIVNIEASDDYTLVIKLKNYSYLFVQSFSINTYMYSSTAIQKNGKQWAISHAYGTGPFMLKSFDPTGQVVVVKNPNYWKPGKPYLDGLIQVQSMDSAVNYAAMKSNETQMYLGGDSNLQKKLVAEGHKQILFTAFPTVEYLVPSTDDPNSPLSNPLVREAIEYAIDRKAICQGVWKGTIEPLDQMSYKGAVGYDPGNSRPYDPAKAKQLLKQAGYPGGKGVSISIYVPVPPPLVAYCTAVAGYLQQVGINAKVVPQTFPLHNTEQAQGWKNGLFYLRDAGESIWSLAFLSWFGPQPTFNAVGSLKRPDEYNQLAAQVLTSPDVETENRIVSQLIKMVHDKSLIIPLGYFPSTWVTQPYIHAEEALKNRSAFDWGSVWTEKP